jgi:hypothetical protein
VAVDGSLHIGRLSGSSNDTVLALVSLSFVNVDLLFLPVSFLGFPFQGPGINFTAVIAGNGLLEPRTLRPGVDGDLRRTMQRNLASVRANVRYYGYETVSDQEVNLRLAGPGKVFLQSGSRVSIHFDLDPLAGNRRVYSWVRELWASSNNPLLLVEAGYVPPNSRIVEVEDPLNADFSEIVAPPDETSSATAAEVAAAASGIAETTNTIQSLSISILVLMIVFAIVVIVFIIICSKKSGDAGA